MKKNLLFLLGFLPLIFSSCEKDYLYVEDVDLNLNGFNGNIKGNYSVFSEKGFDIFYTDGIDTTKICNFKAKPFSCYFDTEMNLVASIDTQGVVKHYYVRNNKGNFEKPELVGSNESLEN